NRDRLLSELGVASLDEARAALAERRRLEKEISEIDARLGVLAKRGVEALRLEVEAKRAQQAERDEKVMERSEPDDEPLLEDLAEARVGLSEGEAARSKSELELEAARSRQESLRAAHEKAKHELTTTAGRIEELSAHANKERADQEKIIDGYGSREELDKRLGEKRAELDRLLAKLESGRKELEALKLDDIAADVDRYTRSLATAEKRKRELE